MANISGLRSMRDHLSQHLIDHEVNENKLIITGSHNSNKFKIYFHPNLMKKNGSSQVVLELYKKGRIRKLIFHPQTNPDITSVLITIQ